ncbi:MAG: hypothetical protein ABJA98_04880 [Acidobacteriota bacterium]
MSVSEQFFGDDVKQTETVNGDSQHAAPAAYAGSTPRLALRLMASTAVIDLGVAPAIQACDQSRPTGATFVAEADCPGGRIYICDPETHTIDVLDRNGRPLFSFGGFGSRLGQLDTPTDVAVIRDDTADSSGETIDAGLLIVADQGNHRLQLFELDGVAIGEIGGHAGAWIPGRFPLPTGSPFFRLGDVPPLPFPSRLEWRAPYLDVACAGTAIRLDLAVVLLPDFATWIADASRAELRLAFLRFASDPNRFDIPEPCLQEIADRLQPAWRRGMVSPQRSA